MSDPTPIYTPGDTGRAMARCIDAVAELLSAAAFQAATMSRSVAEVDQFVIEEACAGREQSPLCLSLSRLGEELMQLNVAANDLVTVAAKRAKGMG